MKDSGKSTHNHVGQTPSDKPGKKLINPPDKENAAPHTNKEPGENSTAKDPKLGNRHTTR